MHSVTVFSGKYVYPFTHSSWEGVEKILKVEKRKRGKCEIKKKKEESRRLN
jgi:CheY-specific phosphatase CheX